MPGKIEEWPAWPEFNSRQSDCGELDQESLAIKRSMIERHGGAALRQGWIKTCSKLKEITKEIERKGNDIIPVFDTTEILQTGLTDSQREEVKRVGAFVCRGTIPKEELLGLREGLHKYVADNKDNIDAWPPESPSILNIYASPVQNTLRTHPNQLRLQRLLNGLWHSSSDETSPDPLIYLDGVRDRSPGQDFLGLGPHIDAGSLCRWADDAYADVYGKILSGYPEQHDCYDLGLRMSADQEFFKGKAHSSILRSFQGWTALSPATLGEGTMLVLPNVATTIAYVVLRPFFRPPEDPNDVMDPEKWTLDDSSDVFPGTFRTQSQRLSRYSHPHLQLEQSLVSIPPIEGGDTVWWHTDVGSALHQFRKNDILTCPRRFVTQWIQSTTESRTLLSLTLLLARLHHRIVHTFRGSLQQYKVAVDHPTMTAKSRMRMKD